MPRICAVCASDDREAFEAAVGGGQTIKTSAPRFGFHYRAAARHVQRHIDRPVAVPAPTGGILDTFEQASGHPPLAWQREVLTETRDTLLLKSRQCGATEAASIMAVHTALTKPGSTSVVISPSLRQSSEVTNRARLFFWRLGEKLRQDSASLLRTAGGSRVISLPGSARGIRGYACELVVIDEASWVADETHVAARPLTATTNGRTVIQSTPGAPVGAFYEMAENPPTDWAFMRITADAVPDLISPAFLERQRLELGEDLFGQEYGCTFGTSAGGLFSVEMIESMFQESA